MCVCVIILSPIVVSSLDSRLQGTVRAQRPKCPPKILKNYLISSGASGDASFNLEKSRFAAWDKGPENRKHEVKLAPLCAAPWSTLW